MSDDSLVDVAPRFLWAHTSPLLADPEWIAGFRWMIERLLSTARRMKHNMPSYRTALVVREWHPFLEGLSLHVMKAVNAGRNGPGIAAYVLDARVDEAFQLTCAMLDDMLDRKAANKDKVPIPLSTLEAINELLETMVAPDAPQAPVSDLGGGTANPSPPSRESTPEGDPISVKVISAAYALSRQGKPVSISAACEKAGVNRSHFVQRYPNEAKAVKAMATPDRQPIRGSKKDGIVEAREDDYEDE